MTSSLRKQQREWIEAILAERSWRRSNLAKAAGIHQSTLSKFINDPNNAQTLDLHTVNRIKRISPFPPYLTKRAPGTRDALEHESQPIDLQDAGTETARLIEAAKAGGNSINAWQLRSPALQSAGFFPGDILIVDMNAAPVDGDLVCVQTFDRNGDPETIFRILEAPFLLAADTGRNITKPLLVGAGQTEIAGTVITTIRPRHAA